MDAARINADLQRAVAEGLDFDKRIDRRFDAVFAPFECPTYCEEPQARSQYRDTGVSYCSCEADMRSTVEPTCYLILKKRERACHRKPDGHVAMPVDLDLYRGIVKRADPGPLRFHDLRQTAASLMLEQGLTTTTVAAILGHANTSTTRSVYAMRSRGASKLVLP